MTRLRTVSPQEPGWRRIRCGRGFRYVDEKGVALGDDQVARVKALVIPPAWTDVWICSHERGHLQALGTDEAGRKQYLYHPAWREQRDAAKFDRVLEMARRLPGVRRRVKRALKGEPKDHRTVLAAAVRLVDLGCFRLGSESYADENGSYGLTTLERRHVRKDGDSRLFSFAAKSGVDQEIAVDDQAVVRVVDALTKGRRASSQLLPLSADEVNDHLRDLFDLDVTAKDFRTWHATVTVAAALASVKRAASRTGRAKQVRAAIIEASELLGNTPTIARSSYVDPRVIDLFEDGVTIEPSRSQDVLDREVVKLLS